jgi:hypothetical protein
MAARRTAAPAVAGGSGSCGASACGLCAAATVDSSHLVCAPPE